MKITKYLLLLAVALFAFACSHDDKDSSSSLEKQTISLSSQSQVITAPSAMQSSSDDHAQMAVSYITMANAMNTYLGYFKAPEGAVKSTTAITAANGRVAASGDVVVYTWSDANSDVKIAYQISETSDSYAFDVFFQFSGSSSWLKYFHAEEKKDRSEGFMNVYDILGIYGDNKSLIMLKYNWSRSGDNFTFKLTDTQDNYYFVVTVNEKTKAGEVTYYSGTIKIYDMTWDTNGNGHWAFYNADDGSLLEEGTWTV
ncbi:hypothetical protein [Ohtaekwangia sp.]|uniref:hypothetical protein n=1 Tax=Ohtaekwangia sp. TaxID=2066019 RepID=UPI002F948374